MLKFFKSAPARTAVVIAVLLSGTALFLFLTGNSLKECPKKAFRENTAFTQQYTES